MYSGITDFLRQTGRLKGPVALIFAEDDTEVDTTLRHHRHLGFGQVLLLAPPHISVPEDLADRVPHICWQPTTGPAEAVTEVIRAAPGTWLYYGFNAEYLFYPFCETRSITELLAFHAEERRDAMLCYVIDLYARDLTAHPDAVALRDAGMDRTGYYALARPDPATGHPRERQLDFFGGLRWRFEEHIPEDRRRIDRIALLRAKPGLSLLPDFRTSDQEYNTYACPWHNNLTAAVVSFRTAKALRRNPGSTYDIDSFCWRNTVPFDWHSQQLLDLGLIEPGQWF